MESSQLDQLIAACSSGRATEDIFAPVVANDAYEDFCKIFSRHIAHQYASGSLSFTVADRAINRLHTFSYVTHDLGMPEYAWDVYLAFDAGEYQQSEDPGGTNSESKYTQPAIQAIVARDSAG